MGRNKKENKEKEKHENNCIAVIILRREGKGNYKRNRRSRSRRRRNNENEKREKKRMRNIQIIRLLPRSLQPFDLTTGKSASFFCSLDSHEPQALACYWRWPSNQKQFVLVAFSPGHALPNFVVSQFLGL